MDLRKKGLLFTLKKGMDVEPFLKEEYLAKGSYSLSRGIFEFPSGRYDVGVQIERGGYGDVMMATSEKDGTLYAVKVLDIIEYKKRDAEEFIRLGIIQSLNNIILEEESKDEFGGPFVPRFHEVAYDKQRKYILMRMERLNDTLLNRYKASSSEENNTIIPRTLAHVAHILDFFQKRLAFNHRDLKPNNVMYNYLPNGDFEIKIIDFGFSCMNYYGTVLKGREYYEDKFKCELRSRDLTFIMYCTYLWCKSTISPTMKRILEYLLTFDTDNQVCRLFIGCYAYGSEGIDRDSMYDFLNNPRVKNPKAIPQFLRTYMMKILGLQNSKHKSPLHSIRSKRIPGLPYCSSQKILNPESRRCVSRDSTVGRSILLKSQRLYSTSLLTGNKTRKRRLTTQLLPCKPHQYRDPFTRRCKNTPKEYMN